ncbi:MAG TPA: hypothetical protein VGF82_15975 [Terracidiphilus sp.]
MTAVAILAGLVCTGTTSCTRTQVALSAAAMATIVVGTTVGVTYAVKHHNHTLEGCVFSDPAGTKLRTSEARIYTLKDTDVSGVKVGEKVKVHGSKVKRAKGDSSGEQVFAVQKLTKDYGPCSVSAAPSPPSTR